MNTIKILYAHTLTYLASSHDTHTTTHAQCTNHTRALTPTLKHEHARLHTHTHTPKLARMTHTVH